MDLCRYKNIFGEPGKGVHKFRIFNIAIVDVLLTVLVAYLVTYFFKIPFICSLVIMFTLGIIAHHLFCVRTTIDRLLFV